MALVQGKLGKWRFKSKNHGSSYEGYMFPLLVQEQLEIWPEQNFRQRKWVRYVEQMLKYLIILGEKRHACMEHIWFELVLFFQMMMIINRAVFEFSKYIF